MLRGTLSNEDYRFREVSLRRAIFTVVWRYWITLVAWFGWCVWAECQPFFWILFFFFLPFSFCLDVYVGLEMNGDFMMLCSI